MKGGKVYFMANKNRLAIELDKFDFEKVNTLSKEDVILINDRKKQITQSSHLLSILSILILITAFIVDLKNSEFVLILIGLISIVTTVYISTVRIKAKRFIKNLIIPNSRMNQYKGEIKVKIYKNKFVDISEGISLLVISMWAVLIIAWSVFKILVNNI